MERTDVTKIAREKNPREKAKFLADFLFCWQLPIVFKGKLKNFSEDDIPEPRKQHRAADLGDKMEEEWQEEEKSKKNPSLERALFRIFGLEFILYGIIPFPIDLTVTLLQPICLRKFLEYFQTNQHNLSRRDAFLLAAAIVLLHFLRVLTFHWFGLQLISLAIKIRASCRSLIYRKFLKMKLGVTIGKTINLMTNDINRFGDAVYYLHYAWVGSVKLLVAIYYLDVTLGHAAVAGTSMFFFSIIAQTYICKKTSRVRMQVAVKTDQRIRLINDVISGIQIIKMYAWEKPFTKLVTAARKFELKEIIKANTLRLTSEAFRQYVSKVSIFICVVAFVLTDTKITPQYFFAVISLFDNLNMSVVRRLHLTFNYYSEMNISLKRIEHFLHSECCSKSKESYKIIQKKKMQPGVCLDKIAVKLDNHLILKDVVFEARPGEVVGVIGHTGSGKTTLLHVILNEIDITKGSVEVGEDLSYASQEAWIFSSTIRQNILFGQKMDEEKYRKVLRVCGLEHDIILFPNGDLTLVGERGIMLSGGQKARINLARAIYRDADIYLLDDPLSAVDPHVAQHIFFECILGYLRSKCVILVTHQIKFLSHASKVYLLNEGTIKIANLKKISNVEQNELVEIKTNLATTSESEVKEHKSSESSNRNTYKKYFLSSGHWLPPLLILSMFVWSQILISSSDCFVAFWINSPEMMTSNNFLYIYSSLIIGAAMVIHINYSLFAKLCNTISKNLHQSMFANIVSTTTKFYNDHSSGRILNRFSQDLGIIDEQFPLFLNQAINVVCSCFGILVIVFITDYWMIIPTILFLVYLYYISASFGEVNLNLRRTQAIVQSPLYTQVVATIRGSRTIRVCRCEKILQEEFDQKLDLDSSASYLYKSLFYTCTFWIDVSCVLYICIVTISFLILKTDSSVGNTGLAITQSGSLIILVQFGLKVWLEIDAQMTSIERLLEYTKLPGETDNGTYSPPKTWPKLGNIKFDSVSMQYSPEKPFVLKNINLCINSGEKIGIIGRTGAGKSSLITVLFRLFDFEGKIYIDGIDTKTIPLHSLRSNISIIPQDPVLFLGSLRKNLDPFEEFNDHQIWSVLKTLQMEHFVQKLPSGLDSFVAENGTNFSVGEKQMLCLVRAMLRNTKIVVFDEATANIDLETDELIQNCVRQTFKECTVLTIAHRLNTVMDSDKILVIDGGNVVEFGEPQELLQDVNGHFYRLIHPS